MKKVYVLLCIFVLGLVACKEDVKEEKADMKKEEHHRSISVSSFLEENNIEEKYPNLKFSIKGDSDTGILKIESFDFLAEDVIKIINLAESNDIFVNVEIGNTYMIYGTYITGNEKNEDNWLVVGYGLDDSDEPTYLESISDDEVLEIYYEHKEDLPRQKALEEVMKDACLTVYHSDAFVKEYWVKGPQDYLLDEQFFVKYYDYISQLSPIDVEKEKTTTFLQYIAENYKEYVVPINHYSDGNKMIYQYLQGNLIIDTNNWTSVVEIMDNSKIKKENIYDDQSSFSDDEIYCAVINTYYSLKNYMNGKEMVGFDEKSLQIITEHYDKIKEWNLFEAPINVDKNSTIQGNVTIRLDYDAGVSIVWEKDNNNIFILQ